jgi:hypothetical protein
VIGISDTDVPNFVFFTGATNSRVHAALVYCVVQVQRLPPAVHVLFHFCLLFPTHNGHFFNSFYHPSYSTLSAIVYSDISCWHFVWVLDRTENTRQSCCASDSGFPLVRFDQSRWRKLLSQVLFLCIYSSKWPYLACTEDLCSSSPWMHSQLYTRWTRSRIHQARTTYL